MFIYIGASLFLETAAWNKGLTWTFLVSTASTWKLDPSQKFSSILRIMGCACQTVVHIGPWSHSCC